MKLLKLVPDHTNVDFMRWRNVALVLSIIATVASIAFTVYRGLNLGIDFVGGQLVRAEFAQPVHDRGAARARRQPRRRRSEHPGARQDDRTYQIRLPKPAGPETASNAVVSKLRSGDPAAISRRAGRCRRIGFGQGQRGACER